MVALRTQCLSWSGGEGVDRRPEDRWATSARRWDVGTPAALASTADSEQLGGCKVKVCQQNLGGPGGL